MPSSSPTPTPTPTATPRSSGGGGGSSSRRDDYIQVERLARPAINEGLIISNNLLNTWNSVPPSVDLTSAAAPIATEATAVLAALGNDQNTINALFTALLPDVMRIDTTRVSGYIGSAPGMLDNVTSQLRPIGGRMIEDDVIDITLALVVPGGAPGASPLPGFESDGVSYAGPNAGGSGHKPVLSEFPYLAAPN